MYFLQVILERHSVSINFENKDSTDYAVGFGNKQSGDFWQGKC